MLPSLSCRTSVPMQRNVTARSHMLLGIRRAARCAGEEDVLPAPASHECLYRLGISRESGGLTGKVSATGVSSPMSASRRACSRGKRGLLSPTPACVKSAAGNLARERLRHADVLGPRCLQCACCG
eukprot:365276-Chlamydomonas_euryale.AAC.4